MAEREDKLYLARLAELAERYDEMVEIMKQVVELDGDLKREDRNLLSVAYKNVIGSRRASWRVLSSIAEKANETSPVLKTYREQVERELSTICNDVLDLLEQYLLPATRSSVESDKSEAIVFYLKMKGDYYRYMAEYQTGADRDATAENALMAYKSASDESIEHLSSTHPIRLGLALNYSVFYYEIIGKRERAQKLAQGAFDDAVKDLEELQQSDNYKDSTLIIQLLRDNLTLWNQGAEEGEGGETTQQQNGGNDD